MMAGRDLTQAPTQLSTNKGPPMATTTILPPPAPLPRRRPKRRRRLRWGCCAGTAPQPAVVDCWQGACAAPALARQSVSEWVRP